MSITAAIGRWFRLRPGSEFDPYEYWEARHRQDFSSLRAVGHRSLTDEANAEQYAVKQSRIVDTISRYVPNPQGRTLLDAGCGIGLLTPAYVELGFEVTGADFCATAIERAKAAGVKARFIVTPLASLTLRQRFDVIVVIDVLLHVVHDGEWRDTLAALSSHLKSNGVLVVVDWLVDLPHDPLSHCRPRSLAHYGAALADHDLTIVEHLRFDLKHERATKDLIVVRRNGRRRPGWSQRPPEPPA